MGSKRPCGGAERTRGSWLFECRLSQLTFCLLAPAAKGRFPPDVSNGHVRFGPFALQIATFTL